MFGANSKACVGFRGIYWHEYPRTVKPNIGSGEFVIFYLKVTVVSPSCLNRDGWGQAIPWNHSPPMCPYHRSNQTSKYRKKNTWRIRPSSLNKLKTKVKSFFQSQKIHRLWFSPLWDLYRRLNRPQQLQRRQETLWTAALQLQGRRLVREPLLRHIPTNLKPRTKIPQHLCHLEGMVPETFQW